LRLELLELEEYRDEMIFEAERQLGAEPLIIRGDSEEARRREV
jgi:hypothetical protein